jgi:DMSO reductase family type II enzyme heme b subunit
MGDAHGPVRLYYWNASRGAEQLTASGRAHVERSGQTFRHQSRHEDGQWTLTLELPELPTPSPVAFAVWDGAVADRNGQKMFSIWYVIK